MRYLFFEANVVEMRAHATAANRSESRVEK